VPPISISIILASEFAITILQVDRWPFACSNVLAHFPLFRFFGITGRVRAYPLANRAGLLVFRGLACVALFINATSANVIDCPTSGNAISTDRPDFTSPPTVVPTGSVQFENGVAWSTEQRSNVVDGPQTLVRFGVAPCMEIFFSVPDYIYAIGGTAPTAFRISSPRPSSNSHGSSASALRRLPGCLSPLAAAKFPVTATTRSYNCPGSTRSANIGLLKGCSRLHG
jgi:hypothetical protein